MSAWTIRANPLRLRKLALVGRERPLVERRIRQARLPVSKSPDSFEFSAIPGLNRMLVRELARWEYILRRENIIAPGNSGAGKRHLALSHGLSAWQKGFSAAFHHRPRPLAGPLAAPPEALPSCRQWPRFTPPFTFLVDRPNDV